MHGSEFKGLARAVSSLCGRLFPEEAHGSLAPESQRETETLKDGERERERERKKKREQKKGGREGGREGGRQGGRGREREKGGASGGSPAENRCWPTVLPV